MAKTDIVVLGSCTTYSPVREYAFLGCLYFTGRKKRKYIDPIRYFETPDGDGFYHERIVIANRAIVKSFLFRFSSEKTVLKTFLWNPSDSTRIYKHQIIRTRTFNNRVNSNYISINRSLLKPMVLCINVWLSSDYIQIGVCLNSRTIEGRPVGSVAQLVECSHGEPHIGRRLSRSL